MAEELNLQAGDISAPRVKLGETGYIGLRMFSDTVVEESRTDLRFPRAIKTFKEMSDDATIASALALFEMMISRVEWTVKCPEGASEITIKRAKFLEQCMHDMEHSWHSFIKEVTSCFTYGFSVHEKVFRRRLKEQGSKYNDGLIGLRKLPIRSQSTIAGWKFSDDGRELEGVIQDLSLMVDSGRYLNLSKNTGGKITIPRNKILLFRTDVSRDNPEGKSPLTKVYLSWRYLKEIKEQEAIGITRDLAGMPILKIPPRYMSDDATVEEKRIYEYYKRVVRNIQNNEQSGLILPQIFDETGRNPLFSFELMGTTGGKSYNTNEIIQRYQNEILQTLFADVLKLGQDGVGSYSLADSKSSLVSMALEARLKEIQNVLQDLTKQLFQLNGWSLEELPYFQYGDLEKPNLEVIGKAIQQLKATSLIAPTAGNINFIAEMIGLPDRIDPEMPQEELNNLLGPMTSRSGDGAAAGGFNGTSKSVSVDDNSASNLDNK